MSKRETVNPDRTAGKYKEVFQQLSNWVKIKSNVSSTNQTYVWTISKYERGILDIL